MSYHLDSEYIQKEVTENRIVYTVKSRYARSYDEFNEYTDGKKPKDESKLITEEQILVFVKGNGRWLVDDFEDPAYVPEGAE